MHRPHRRNRDVGREGDRGGRSRRRQRSVVTVAWPARRIAEELPRYAVDRLGEIARPVTGGQSPHVRAIAPPTPGILDRIALLGIGGAAAILEIVDALARHVTVADAFEIDPDMAVLMAEQRWEVQMRLTPAICPAVLEPARPGGPGALGQRMGGGAQRQQIEQHTFVVDIPVGFDEARLRMPAHRQQGCARRDPGPVDRAVNPVGQRTDPRLVGMVAIIPALREQHAAQQQRGIHGRQLAPGEAQPLGHAQELVENALIAAEARLARALRRVGEELQRGQRAGARLFAGDPAIDHADRIGGQREPDSGDRGEGRRRPAIGGEPRLGIGRLPEEAEGPFLQIADQVGLHGGDEARRRDPPLPIRASRHQRGQAQPARTDQLAAIIHGVCPSSQK